VFDSLDVRALLVLPWEFQSPLRPGHPSLIALSGSAPTTRYFGGAVDVASVEITPRRGVEADGLVADARRIRLVGMRSQVVPTRVVATADSATAFFRAARGRTGIVLPRRDGGPGAFAVAVSPVGHAPFSPTGLLAAYVRPPHWIATGSIGTYLLLRNTRAYGLLTAFAPSGRGRATATIRVVSSSPWTPTETVAVDAPRPVLLVRGVADLPGWHVTVVAGGRQQPASLEQRGVVQAVELPAGRSLVTFRYDPPGLRAGLLLAAAGCALLAGLVAFDLARARRRRAPA
jgi:hypothetical protein